MRRIFAVCYLLFAVFALSTAHSAVDNALVQRAERYLNSITGLSGNFEQTHAGTTDRGTFSMLRPGRIRLDYTTSPIQLIANGRDLFFVDNALEQITTVPMSATPAGILVRDNISLRGSDIIVSETMQDQNTFSVRMHMQGAEGMGNMLMTFNNNPVSMAGWTVVDATGAVTTIRFSNLTTRTNFGRNFFQVQGMRATGMAGGDTFFE
ncbi:MAG: outer membrane lipoprotein carrier protein LolA [Alphaproteobacteria bacterium]|nr:outer membrane lipoprotein carrier protein LolA [Alphaproteobacteria bacterium]